MGFLYDSRQFFGGFQVSADQHKKNQTNSTSLSTFLWTTWRVNHFTGLVGLVVP
jgi:hypothetical protein